MTSTTFQTQLLRQLSSKKANSKNIIQQGFTLVELMVVIVIVGILSAVALPQFLSQTQKARATEATQMASSIIKQAAAEYLLDKTASKFTTIDGTCEEYAGARVSTNLPTDAQFTYGCAGNATAFTVTATGRDNALGTTVTITGNLDTGTFGNPVVTTS